MRIGTGMAGMEAVRDRKGPEERGGRFRTGSYSEAMSFENSMWMISGSRVQELEEKDGREENGVPKEKAEAEKIYQAAVSGKPNPVENLREASKVPYGYLAKDGVIEYNGVCFVCDEKTNSICLGDMTDTKNVLTITLSGGGHLKVNRNSVGLLSRAAGMFSPEDLNLIMRAIAQDAKIMSVQKEIEDADAEIGNQLGNDGSDGNKET
ncbi:MAG: hypothetical protein HFH91_06985 [Lachnospiraceae bacterium]|nr:hypothetical protein [Lachnospiraceae bacterium]